MKLNRFFFTLVLVLACCTRLAYAQALKVSTYNLRFDNPGDAGNLWVDRAPIVAALIRFHDFDVFGTQEALKHQLDDITNTMPQYERYGIGRDDGKDKGEHSAIFFKKDKFRLLNKGDFWLSQTPDKPSLGWDATCCNRICSWVYLQDIKTKRKFYFFNAHYDHQGVVARNEGSKLILAKIKAIAGNEPVVLTGDFNATPDSECYKNIANSGVLKDTFKEVNYPYVNNGSFNGFGKQVDKNEVIDHIFVSKAIKVLKWGVLTDTYHGKFPSDHFPVMAELSF
ncbi:endonuclease/exonuclease/phosphatase family protein [Solitalea lacus]|uniref:endonuclease/exonuclease/phosphatase family protein n=1 Tax=Solitalea lacus TaxID=2911172 RepID=UPI001EDA68B4|nr:endonuclease/exonuclease/phosphatase family protein [Solitalea lacus]UKJ06881.1 endonuclease/exonuclease/phosphatase family protein [Solitalea lacus]